MLSLLSSLAKTIQAIITLIWAHNQNLCKGFSNKEKEKLVIVNIRFKEEITFKK